MFEEGERLTEWSSSTKPSVRHVKIRFHLHRDLRDIIKNRLSGWVSSINPSFAVVRNVYVYNVYFGGCVNCTSIEDLDDAPAAVRHFKFISGLIDSENTDSLGAQEYVVDNITLCGRFGMDLRLTEIAQALPQLIPKSAARGKFRPTTYRALHLSFPKTEGGGLVTLYQSGGYIVKIVFPSSSPFTANIYFFFSRQVLHGRRQNFRPSSARLRKGPRHPGTAALAIRSNPALTKPAITLVGKRMWEKRGRGRGGEGESNVTTTCKHGRTTDDEFAGDIICVECGLVLQRLLDISYASPAKVIDPDKKKREEKFLDACDANMMNEGLSKIANQRFETFRKDAAAASFGDDELAAFSLYYAALEEGAGRPPAEISAYMHVDVSAVYRLEGIFQPPLQTVSPTSFLPRYCSQLGIGWQREKEIASFCKKVTSLDGRDPRTIAAAAIFLHNEMVLPKSAANPKVTRKGLADLFNISRSAIGSCILCLRKELARKKKIVFR